MTELKTKLDNRINFCYTFNREKMDKKKIKFAPIYSDKIRLNKRLHDTVAQTLTIACLKLDVLLMEIPPEKSGELKEISKILRASTKDIRKIINELKIAEGE